MKYLTSFRCHIDSGNRGTRKNIELQSPFGTLHRPYQEDACEQRRAGSSEWFLCEPRFCKDKNQNLALVECVSQDLRGGLQWEHLSLRPKPHVLAACKTLDRCCQCTFSWWRESLQKDLGRERVKTEKRRTQSFLTTVRTLSRPINFRRRQEKRTFWNHHVENEPQLLMHCRSSTYACKYVFKFQCQ